MTKWEMYVESLQGHPSICRSEHTVESMGFVTTIMPPNEFGAMLNVGAGEGLESWVLYQLGYKTVVSIVRGKINLEFAKSHFAIDSSLHFLDGDMHDLPFPSESFDCIYTNQVFEHSFAPFICLLEFNAVLRPFGRVWLGLPQFKEVDDPTAHPDINLIGHHHPNILCENLYRQYFKKTGFTVIELKSGAEGNPYFDNGYLLEKRGDVHSDVAMALAKRKKLFG